MNTESLFETAASTPVSIVFRAGYYLKQIEFEGSISQSLKEHGFSDFEAVRRAASGRIFITFDLSNSYWYDLGTTLWLITLLHKLRKQGNDLQLWLPEPVNTVGKKLWSFLKRWRFFECLAQNVDLPVNILRPSQIAHLSGHGEYTSPDSGVGLDLERTIFHKSQLLEINALGFAADETTDDPTSQFIARCSDKILMTGLGQVCGWTFEEARQFAKQVLFEAVRNASHHAEGSFSLVAMRMDGKNLVLAVADNGIGIPAKIRKFVPDLSNQSDAELIRTYADSRWVVESHLDSYWIRQATEKNKAFPSPGRVGDGLHYLKTNVLNHNGELRIRSGKACVDFACDDPSGKSRDLLDVSPGTMMRMIIPRKSL
jgi:hypothetical protein